MNKYSGDIRFWILIFFLVRLIGITQPPLEVGHNWRQTTVNMVARNFLEIDNNIAYPRIDIAGEKTGITGMEFPLLNYMIYIMAEVFGYDHWYGRLINLFFSSLGIFYFYKILNKYFDHNIAHYASLILLSSIWFSISRKIMPDTFSMSLILAGIYYGSNYLESKKSAKGGWNLLLYSLLIMMGVLSKLPSGYILVIFILFVFNSGISFKRRLIFIAASLFGILPGLLWYFYWVPHLVESFGFWHFFMGKNFSQGISEVLENYGDSLKRFYETALKYIGFAFFVFGVVQAFIQKQKLILNILLLSFASFMVIVFKAGYNFPHHSYYIVPFVPVMALLAGYGIDRVKNKKWMVIFLVAICLEGVLNQHHDFKIKDEAYSLMQLESDLDAFSSRDDLILINSGDYPSPMYFAHRKGWVLSNEQINDTNKLEELRKKGLMYIVILKRVFGNDSKLDFELVLDNPDYRIYKL